ncbi:peroxisome biogenesis protein 12 [Dioscorea cayenensis subsp. rotundata]|uniref:Peroxisome biogenesis protein 12 n=1 Tax=Dioscorea cayennensis subsp. rotundata TaxID=55577 RepID=A0AB40C2E2_DIOCR|nr:peroxisome biogenesis protein 12 [Dioscorea cayenensis subsp. rotundata]
MLFQVGGQGTRPTFFEMAAAQQLPASLRAALSYSLGVFAMRRPFLHKVLDYEDEFFALLMLVLETHSLRTADASFAESLYGLRRRAVEIIPEKHTSLKESNDRMHLSGLRKKQKILSVAFMVILPYIRSKLHSIYNREREARLQASLWAHDDTRLGDTDYLLDRREISPVSDGDMVVEESSLMQAKRKIMAVIGACYPSIHATNEGLSFAYQLLYLLDATRFYSPSLHALGVQVSRATGQELMDAASRISRIRSREIERLRGPPWLKAFQRILLSCIYTSLDYAQTGLIAAVFFFKMMEWWYQSAEERMSAPTVYPPPLPPPPPKVAEEGIPLPSDKSLCPLCSQKRVSPSVLAASGFVFCYTCICKYITQYKRCPITLIPATVEQVRRLFHDF